MKRYIFAFVAFALLYGGTASAASVTIESIPTVCSSAVFRGTASYTAPETLRVSLNNSVIATFTSGESSWSVTSQSFIAGTNTLKVEVLSALNAVIATQSQSFGTNCGNGDPMKVTQVWGLDGYHTPIVSVGTVISDEFGFKSICDLWMPSMGCFDISKTNYYRLPVMQFLKK